MLLLPNQKVHRGFAVNITGERWLGQGTSIVAFLGWEVGQGLQKTNVYFVPPDAI